MASRHDFVVVHGAWTGSWSWQRVVDRLHAGGHRAFAPTLTGLAEKSHLLTPAVNLDTHIDDIVNEITWKDLTDIVLVAHSYGGIVGCGVIERVPERVGAVVFVEAFIPENGASFADLAGMSFDGLAVPPWPSSPGDYLREADRAWVDGKASPHPTASFTQSAKVTGAYERVPRKTYIVATGWADSFTAMGERFRDQPGWTVREIPCGHDVPVDMPDELTRMLIEAQ